MAASATAAVNVVVPTRAPTRLAATRAVLFVSVDGDPPYVLRSLDSGRTWERRDLPAGIVGIDELVAVDRETAWLIGNVPDPTPGMPVGCGGVPPLPCHAAILGTTDGGRTWTEGAREPFVRHAPASGLSHLTAADRAHAWATTAHGCQDLVCPADIVATSDGVSWASVGRLPDLVQSLRFVDALHGWATTRHFTDSGRPDAVARLYRTDDGGRTWRSQFFATGYSPVFAADLADERNGWILGWDYGQCSMGGCGTYSLYRTRDGGDSWDRVQAPPEAPGTPRWWAPPPIEAAGGFLSYVKSAGVETLWIGSSPGAGSGVGGVLMSTDAGTSWRRPSIGDARTDVSVVAPVSSTAGWILATPSNESASVFRTTDGGRSWEKVALP